jgi:hypothetical protein
VQIFYVTTQPQLAIDAVIPAKAGMTERVGPILKYGLAE